jgi:hypothetical protein
MKPLKLLIFALLFVAGQQTFAQNVEVHNNYSTNVSVDFVFKFPCATVSTTTPAFNLTTTPFTPGCGLLSLDVSFMDNTCAPPALVTFSFNFTSNPTMATYTLCNGQVLHFDVHYNGNDYIIDIN